MNVIDWTGDGPLWDKGEEWYPSAEELQIRHMTPSYHAFRMIARAITGNTAWPILRYGMDNPSSSGPADMYDGLKVLTVDQGKRLVCTVLNTAHTAASGLILNLDHLGQFQSYVVRMNDGKRRWYCTSRSNYR